MRFNILFASSIKIYGGGEVWITTMMKELSKLGHSVALICPADSAIKQKAIESSLDVIPFKFKGDFDPLSVFRLLKIINDKKIDFIITNMHKEQRLCGLASKLSKRTKVIAVKHVDIPIKNNFYYKLTYNTLTNLVITNSEATKQTLLKSAGWLNPSGIKVIYHGIDTAPYKNISGKAIRDELNISSTDPVIGFVGRLSVQKGIVYMLEAFKLLKEKIPEVHLVIAGTGGLESEVKNKSKEYGYQSSVHLLGFREDIPGIMQGIDLLLLPSLWEGFGIALIEAMAAGKPCVATKISSIPEIVEDNVNGLLVPPKDSAAIANACVKILTNAPLADKMGKAGKRIVTEKFSIEKMIDEYEELFKSLVK